MTGVDAGLAPIRALVSIHDVMPETLDRVRGLLARCADINPGPVTLLVVPGRTWDAAGIDQLRAWQAAGHNLAGHGWLHHVERFGGLAHRLGAGSRGRHPKRDRDRLLDRNRPRSGCPFRWRPSRR